MYPIFRLINSYDFPCFNRIRLEISLQFRKKVEHTLLQIKWLFDDNLWALSIHPTTNKAHCFNQFIAPSALLLKKKIHWTCKWIILIEWRLLKKYVTCLHRDAVRKTDVHSFFFFFFFLALYLWDSETRLYYCSESILYPLSDKMSYDRKSSLSTRGSLCQTLVKYHKKKTPVF